MGDRFGNVYWDEMMLRFACQGKADGVYLGHNGGPLKVIEQGRQMIKLVCSRSLFSEII